MQIWYTHELVSTPIVLNPRQPVDPEKMRV